MTGVPTATTRSRGSSGSSGTHGYAAAAGVGIDN